MVGLEGGRNVDLTDDDGRVGVDNDETDALEELPKEDLVLIGVLYDICFTEEGINAVAGGPYRDLKDVSLIEDFSFLELWHILLFD